MDTNYSHVLYAGICSIFPGASCLGQSKMGCGRSRGHAIDGLVRFPFPRIPLDFTVEAGHSYCESKIQTSTGLTRL